MAKAPAKPTRAKRKVSKRGRVEGRPGHQPTPQTQELVRTLNIAGWNEERIAAVVGNGIDAKTLRKYYRDQLDLGKAQVDAMVTQCLVLKAIGGQPIPGQPLKWREAETTAAIFYAKTRMGWKEPPAPLDENSNGNTIRIIVKGGMKTRSDGANGDP
jgi:hypothetical protein